MHRTLRPLLAADKITLPRSLVVFNAAFLLAMAYSGFYLILDFFAGFTWSSFVGVPLWLAATYFQQNVSARQHGRQRVTRGFLK
jgi:uncharacterized membrane protein YGL010W